MLQASAIWAIVLPILKSVVVMAVAVLIYYVIKNKLFTRLERLCASTESELDDRLLYFVRNLLSIFILFFALITILDIYDVEISPLLAGAGIFGVSLAFAAKETVADILAGIFLIADRPIRIGDRIKINSIGGHWGNWGDVADIGLRRTRIRNTDGVNINYPNNLLSNSIITNFSYDRDPIRARIRFQVAYEADINFVRSLVLSILEKNTGVIPGTGQLVLRSIGDEHDQSCISAVTLEARYRIANVRKRTEIRSDILEELLTVMKKHDIPLPKLSLDQSQGTDRGQTGAGKQ